jgi:hypothetical protein
MAADGDFLYMAAVNINFVAMGLFLNHGRLVVHRLDNTF